ncbi:MAG: hypothetical protein R6X31_01745 [Anaerolineae bacterium]
MYSRTDLHLEAREALETVWFVRSLEEIERTDLTLSLRMYIGPEFFVQAFLGERSGSLYFALVERRRRIFGIDREGGEWHLHPFDSPDEHKPLPEGLGPRPLLSFLAKVEDLLLQHELL